MKRFGLIGYPLGHSYSKEFFENKFSELKLSDYSYELFEIEYASEFPGLWLAHKDLKGVNVTVPHKQLIIKYLDEQDASAIKVGAVNVVNKEGNKLKGYNTDYLAFKESLINWLPQSFKEEALILGSGGAAKAVQASLIDLEIPYSLVSRNKLNGDYTYEEIRDLPKIFDRFRLIINTTPLGMHPKVDSSPDIPYYSLSKNNLLYDIVYNPSETMFMKKGIENGSLVKNGYEMLIKQAEKSWEIWSIHGV